ESREIGVPWEGDHGASAFRRRLIKTNEVSCQALRILTDTDARLPQGFERQWQITQQRHARIACDQSAWSRAGSTAKVRALRCLRGIRKGQHRQRHEEDHEKPSLQQTSTYRILPVHMSSFRRLPVSPYTCSVDYGHTPSPSP